MTSEPDEHQAPIVEDRLMEALLVDLGQHGQGNREDFLARMAVQFDAVDRARAPEAPPAEEPVLALGETGFALLMAAPGLALIWSFAYARDFVAYVALAVGLLFLSLAVIRHLQRDSDLRRFLLSPAAVAGAVLMLLGNWLLGGLL